VRRAVERCGDCSHGKQCDNHRACVTQPDAALASAIGAAWAVFVRGQVDVRKPWPPYGGRAEAIALRLVAWLAADPRRSELARICHWRAGLKWRRSSCRGSAIGRTRQGAAAARSSSCRAAR